MTYEENKDKKFFKDEMMDRVEIDTTMKCYGTFIGNVNYKIKENRILDEKRKKLEKALGSRSFFASTDLVKMGLFGSKSTVSALFSSGKVITCIITERRRVIMREDLIEYILNQ